MAIARFGSKAKTTLARIGRQAKIPHGLCAKMTAVVVLGMCFIFIWSFFSSTPDSLSEQRESFNDITESLPAASHSNEKVTTSTHSAVQSSKHLNHQHKQPHHGRSSKKPTLKKKEHDKVNKNTSLSLSTNGEGSKEIGEETVTTGKGEDGSERSENEELEKGTDESDKEGEGTVVGSKEDVLEGEGEEGNEDGQKQDLDLEDGVDVKVENEGDDTTGFKIKEDKKKRKGPVFDPKAQYNWKLCGARSKHNYIPCIDIESSTGKIQIYRHHERSCPRTPPMCLVPLPPDGYDTPVPWPESKLKILHKNVAHPKLIAYIKTQSWLVEYGDYIMFPKNQSIVVSDGGLFLESIEEMVPDIEWGKNVRVVLDIGVTDSSFAASLFDKDVLTLALGLKNDLVDLAQVAIERGFPAIVSPFATKRLPFPSGAFDAIHCSGCNVHWHSSGGKFLEMNRILRPGGYFILSSRHNSIEAEEAMTSLTASICWNVLADKTDEVTEVGVKIYQKPDSNSIYELRRRKNPALCNENENSDAAWKVPISHCLHRVPTAIEQHGTEWPAEWPKRLESYPDWLSDKERVMADTDHWKAIVEKSYLTGFGIDWRNVRNVMDMKALNGGFAAALYQHKVWVMNVVPVHAPNTLPYIYERGLFGVYHDWCDSFGTYPRSYDLLHADHLFSRLKNRCNQPVTIVVEMDRITRSGGWVIVRDKLVILEPLEAIFRSLNWEIRMTFSQDKEGILVAQKTTWRP